MSTDYLSPYVISVRKALRISLWNSGQGLPVANGSLFNCIAGTDNLLSASNGEWLDTWNYLQSNDPKSKFNEIVFGGYDYSDRQLVFDERMMCINPGDTTIPDPCRPDIKSTISEQVAPSIEQTEIQPNCYVVFEAMTDVSRNQTLIKTFNLERMLSALLRRKQAKLPHPVHILQVVRVCGTVTTTLGQREELYNDLFRYRTQLPLLWQLASAGRYFCFERAIDEVQSMSEYVEELKYNYRTRTEPGDCAAVNAKTFLFHDKHHAVAGKFCAFKKESDAFLKQMDMLKIRYVESVRRKLAVQPSKIESLKRRLLNIYQMYTESVTLKDQSKLKQCWDGLIREQDADNLTEIIKSIKPMLEAMFTATRWQNTDSKNQEIQQMIDAFIKQELEKQMIKDTVPYIASFESKMKIITENLSGGLEAIEANVRVTYCELVRFGKAQCAVEAIKTACQGVELSLAVKLLESDSEFSSGKFLQEIRAIDEAIEQLKSVIDIVKQAVERSGKLK